MNIRCVILPADRENTGATDEGLSAAKRNTPDSTPWTNNGVIFCICTIVRSVVETWRLLVAVDMTLAIVSVTLILVGAVRHIDAFLMDNKNISSCHYLPWLHPCEQNGYDRMTPPQLYEDGATTEVRIQIHVESIGNFKAGSMDYDMDIYFIEFWRDTRLRHNHSAYMSFNDQLQLNRLWLPDMYFANSKSAEFNYVTVPNYVLKVQPSGECRFSVRVHLKISCHMNLKAYPIDKQKCFLKIVSYGSTTDKMVASWINDSEPITMNSELTGTDLKVDRVSASYCDGSYFDMEFSCLVATFYLKRDIGYSLLQTYCPTSFIVVISWISFWIDPTSVPGRIGLSVTALLTLSTHAIGMHYQLPPVSYAKAQDVWFGACIAFLFASLIEFALVNMYQRRADNVYQKARFGQKRMSCSTKETLLCGGPGNENGNVHSSPSRPLINENVAPLQEELLLQQTSSYSGHMAPIYKRRAGLIDRYSRILFPVCFAIFAVVYWCVYLFAVVT